MLYQQAASSRAQPVSFCASHFNAVDALFNNLRDLIAC